MNSVMNSQFPVTLFILALDYIIGAWISASRDIKDMQLRAGTLRITMDFGATTPYNVHLTVSLILGLVGLGFFILFLVLITCGLSRLEVLVTA